MNPPKFLLLGAGAGTEEAEERRLIAEDSLEDTAVLPADLGTSGYDVVPPHQHHQQQQQEQQQHTRSE